jgi:hypothetical protein
MARAAWPFAVLALLYLLIAWRVIGLAGLRHPTLLYWHDWQDQSLYIRSTAALAAGNFDPALHYYPLLYPLLGLPFLTVWPSQPFFVADLACYLLAFAGFRGVTRAFGLPGWGAILLFVATTLAQFGIAKLWIEPWTTTPAAALLWLALGAMAGLWDAAVPRRRPGSSSESFENEDNPPQPPPSPLGPGLRRGSILWTQRHPIILGLSLGLLPFARPGDAIIGAIVAIASAVALHRARNRRATLYAIASFALAFAAVGMLYLAIYGPHPSPYMLYSAQYGFNFAWLGWKAYVLLVDPRAWFGEGVGLLDYAPWLLLGGAGMFAAYLWGPRCPVVLAVGAAGLVYTVLMLAYVDLLPTGLWRFNNLHYFKWLFPLYGLFAVQFVLDARRRPIVLLAGVPILFALTIKLDPVRVGPLAPARMVIFPKPMSAEWLPTYFATAWTRDMKGEQRNSFDYHQILFAGRVRAIALRRPFAGQEQWLGDDHVRAQLEGKDIGGYAPLYLTGPWPKTPLARYGMKVSFGLPDWFRSHDPPLAK